MEILNKLPIELKCKIISYHERPPHYYAIKNGLFPIRDAIIMMNMAEEHGIPLEILKLNQDLFDLDDVYYQPESYGWFD